MLYICCIFSPYFHSKYLLTKSKYNHLIIGFSIQNLLTCCNVNVLLLFSKSLINNSCICLLNSSPLSFMIFSISCCFWIFSCFSCSSCCCLSLSNLSASCCCCCLSSSCCISYCVLFFLKSLFNAVIV